MRLHAALLALPAALLVPSTLAIFADDAFRTDYHIPLTGAPLPDTTFFQQPLAESKATLIYTLSAKGVLAAVNPKDGGIVWRQRLTRGDESEIRATGSLRAGEGQDTVVSGWGEEVQAWGAAEGRMGWRSGFGEEVVDLEILEQWDGAAGKKTGGDKDVLVLTGGERPVVRRLDGEKGEVKWEYEDKRYDVSCCAIVACVSGC